MKEPRIDDNFIQAVYYDTDQNKFCLNEKGLSELLNEESVKDKSVVVISVAGAFRKGKSFLLNYFVRYLTHIEKLDIEDIEKLNPDDMDWIGEANLTGFPWRGGSERETDGILVWKRPFLIKKPNGNTLVVILMDTQGAFDDSSSVKDCATIFAISTMLSSYQIYNISCNLQENDLDHLHLFTEYGRVALESSEFKPFQNLMFLIRDWSYPYEFNFGSNENFLKRKLTISENQPNDVKNVRRHIRDCFENVSMYLLPHPGLHVSTSPSFVGNPSELDQNFKKYLSNLAYFVLSPQNISPKISQGNPIKCCDLLTYSKTYMGIFESGILPEPKSLINATAEANHLVAQNSSKTYYDDNMSKFCGGEAPYVSKYELDQHHKEIREKSISLFNSFKKMGGEEFTIPYRNELETYIQNSFEEYMKINEKKSVSSFKFVALSFIISILAFLVSQILDAVGLDIFMLPFDIVFYICLLACLFAIGAQFTGGYSHVIYSMDKFCDNMFIKAKDVLIDKYLHSKMLLEKKSN